MNINLEDYFAIDKTRKHLLLYLKVTASARLDQIHEFIKIDGVFYLKLSVQKPPDKNKANKAIIDLISKNLEIPKSSCSFIRGLTSNKKLLMIKNIEPGYLKSKILPYIK